MLALKPNKGLEYFTQLIEAGVIAPVIDSRFALKDVPDALRHFEAAAHQGKVVICVADMSKASAG